jgi:hypothetical protein
VTDELVVRNVGIQVQIDRVRSFGPVTSFRRRAVARENRENVGAKRLNSRSRSAGYSRRRGMGSSGRIGSAAQSRPACVIASPLFSRCAVQK